MEIEPNWKTEIDRIKHNKNQKGYGWEGQKEDGESERAINTGTFINI